MSPSPGSIGPYRLGDVLGRGGMGEVYRAWDARLERWVAIKHIRLDRQHDPVARQRFRREARSVAALSHPAVVPIFDFLETEDGDWIVMELVEGSTCADLLKNGPLDLSTTLELACAVATGLAYAHGRGLVHRDLKAENIILSATGAKILDFGLAKRVGAHSEGTTLTLEGAVLGTCRTLSPEQAQGSRADERSDLYSLGVLVYECLAGFSPFEAATQVATLTRVCTHQQAALTEVDPGIPKNFSNLVDRLLEKLPERRPQSAAEVADALAAMARDSERGARDETRDRDPEAAHAVDETARYSGPELAPGAGPSAERRGGQGRLAVTWRAMLLISAASIVLFLGFSLTPELGRSFQPDAAPAESRSRALSAQEAVQQGFEALRSFYRQNHVERAIELFEQALTADDENAMARVGLCRCYLIVHRRHWDALWVDQAREQAQMAVELNGQLERARSCLAEALLLQGRVAEAQTQIHEALELNPLSPRPHQLRAGILYQDHRYDEAREAYAKAIEVAPAEWQSLEKLGSLELRLGDYAAALSALSAAAERAPDNAVIQKNLGVACFGLQRFDEAAAHFQRSLELEPTHGTYTNLGTLEFYRGRYSAALRAFEQAVEMGAHHYLNWANLGDALRFTPGRRAEAVPAYRRAIQLLQEALAERPEDPTLISRLALYRAKAGETGQAMAELERMDLDRVGIAQVHYRAAQTLELTQRRERALQALERALLEGLPLADVRREPELTALRQDARYHRMVVRLSP